MRPTDSKFSRNHFAMDRLASADAKLLSQAVPGSTKEPERRWRYTLRVRSGKMLSTTTVFGNAAEPGRPGTLKDGSNRVGANDAGGSSNLVCSSSTKSCETPE